MAGIAARIRSVTKPSRRLELASKGLLSELVSFMDQHTDKALTVLKTYPPPRGGSNYVRTFTLQRAWRRTDTRLTNAGLITGISNDAVDPRGSHYSELVHGSESGMGQLSIHSETGWPLMAEVLRAGYVQGLKRTIKNAL